MSIFDIFAKVLETYMFTGTVGDAEPGKPAVLAGNRP
jgi:hypothetical protein